MAVAIEFVQPSVEFCALRACELVAALIGEVLRPPKWHSACPTLCQKLSNLGYQINGNLHGRVRGRLERCLIFGHSFFV